MRTSNLPPLKDVYTDHVLVDNLNHRTDYDLVLSFGRLKGRPSRPIDQVISVRSTEEFQRLRQRFAPDFFGPFNDLLALVNLPPIRVEPDLTAIASWNNRELILRLVSQIAERLAEGGNPRLIPMLVWAFRNLEIEYLPPADAWGEIDLITIPGSRTYDRTAEAFRAYVRTQGRAVFITSGKVPYYDQENQDMEVTESKASAAYLRLLGVPNDRIYPEVGSRDTVENAEFLSEAISQIEGERETKIRRVLLVTSPFHLARYHLNVSAMLEAAERDIEIYTIGSKASRYWAETYFMADAKSGYTPDHTMGVVLNEYLKIAFDLCAMRRPPEVKPFSPR